MAANITRSTGNQNAHLSFLEFMPGKTTLFISKTLVSDRKLFTDSIGFFRPIIGEFQLERDASPNLALKFLILDQKKLNIINK